MKLRFVNVDGKAGLLERLHHFFDMFLMIFQCITKDENVIKVCGTKVIEEVPKCTIDEALKGEGSAAESKGHHHIFKLFESSLESCLPFFSSCDPRSIKGRDNIELGVEPRLAQSVQGFSDCRNRVEIFDGDGVRCSIIHAKPKVSFGFLYQDNGGGWGELEGNLTSRSLV